MGAEALLVRAGGLGDVLLLRRAVAGLRGHHRRILLIAPRSAGAALVGPGRSEVDELIAWERPDVAALFVESREARRANESRFARGGDDLAEPLRQRLREVDLAIVYSRSAALARGLATVLPRVIAHDPAPPATVHASRWLARPVEALGLSVAAEPEPMRPTAAEAADARQRLSGLPEAFVAVHPGSGSPRKNWPPERFAELLDALAPREPWLLVEGPADAEAAARLGRRPGTVLARNLRARTLGAVLARARLVIGHDSGVSHLAAAWGARTVALFGPTDPAVWAPVGPRVSIVPAPEGRMESLTVEAVAAAARSLG